MMHHKLDIIKIKNLRVRTLIGINPEEKIKKQDVVINIEMYANLSKACLSDEIKETVDYKIIKDQIVHHTEKNNYGLLEMLCEKISEICLKNKHVHHCSVEIDKPGALRFAESVSLTIFRSQDD